VPVEAIPLALISSLYPLGLAAILLLARAARPRPKVSVFLAGALVCTLAVGLVVVFALHGAGVGQSSQRSGAGLDGAEAGGRQRLAGSARAQPAGVCGGGDRAVVVPGGPRRRAVGHR
jgi:hypothetical protein